MPDAEVWMTIGELANLFYVRGVSVEAAIRRLGKDGIMGGESCRRIRLGEKCYTEVYGMEHGNGHRLVVPVRHGAGGPVPQVDCPDGGTFRERAYGHVPALSARYVLLNGTDTA